MNAVTILVACLPHDDSDEDDGRKFMIAENC